LRLPFAFSGDSECYGDVTSIDVVTCAAVGKPSERKINANYLREQRAKRVPGENVGFLGRPGHQEGPE
jgi:hypothetical protein